MISTEFSSKGKLVFLNFLASSSLDKVTMSSLALQTFPFLVIGQAKLLSRWPYMVRWEKNCFSSQPFDLLLSLLMSANSLDFAKEIAA